MNREHDASPETIVERLIIPFDRYTTCYQIVRMKSDCLRTVHHSSPFFWRVTEFEFFDDILTVSALFEVVESNDLSHLSLPQALHKKLTGPGAEHVKAFPFILCGKLCRRALHFFNLDRIFIR